MMKLPKPIHATLAAKAGVMLALVAISQIVFDGSGLGAVVGAFALTWLGLLAATRRAVLRVAAARTAAIVAAIFGVVLVDDPSLIAWTGFWIALSLAALLPRRGFDDALAWAYRLAWHAAIGLISPFADAARIAAIRKRKVPGTGSVRAALGLLLLPLGGGAVFVALFASANPLIANAFAGFVPPDPEISIWRVLLAGFVSIAVWTSLRPSAVATQPSRVGELLPRGMLAPGAATLTLSLITFNALFAVENGLDIAFLWSGAPLPTHVTMADYAHRGAYALIVTAVLAGAFVLVALRPGSAGAANAIIRRLVIVWVAQNVLLVASSALRTLDYVDAYGMTVLRLAALLWMALVAIGLALIGWRLWAGRSVAWMINANALAAAAVIGLASMVDLGATAAAWNTRVALDRGRSGPPLDLCYMARLGPSALVSLATLEHHAGNPALRDRLAWLRWNAQSELAQTQAHWRSWTPRAARRLSAVEAIVGPRSPMLLPAWDGRGCDGAISRRPASLPAPAPSPLTKAAER